MKLKGVPLGYVALVAKTDESRYSAAFKVRSTGMLDMIYGVEIDSSASGRFIEGGLQPAKYAEDSEFGSRSKRLVLEYQDGVPFVAELEPPPDDSRPLLDPLEQAGTLDPLSSLYFVFKDAPESEICSKDFFLFDGQRRAHITVGEPIWDGSAAACECLFIRIEGYNEDEMAKRKEFPFSVRFERSREDSSQYRLVLLEGVSKFGRISLELRR